MIGPRRRAALAGLWAAAVGLLWLVLAGTVAGQAIPAPTGLTVQASAPTPQHPSVDMTVRWQGIADTSADYEIESAIRRNDSVEPFAPISRAWAPERHPDRTFTILETRAFEPSFDGWMCYRVRAVKGSAAGPYSTEECVAGPLAKGSPSTAAPPLPTSPPPLRDFPPPPGDPLNPLNVRYATLQGYSGPEPSWARPKLVGGTMLQGETAIREAIPTAAFLEPGDAEGFVITEAQARSAPGGRFDASVYYQAVAYEKFFQRKTITLFSWTKEGDFLYVGYSSSPTSITRQTTVNGLYALTTMPTPAMFEGRGTREVFFTMGGRIYYLVAENYTEDQPVLDIAARLAVRYANVPGAPDTGEGIQGNSARGISQFVIAGLVAIGGSMIGLGIGITVARRW